MRADRLIGILLFLDRKRKVTAHELAEEFEVSVRTIYRDINTLLLDFPIRAEAGPDGGYSFMEGYKLPNLPFSKKEVAALTLMGSVAGQKIGLIEGKVFKEAFSKLLANLSRAYKNEVGKISDRVLIDIEPWKPPPKTPEVLASIKGAFEENLVLEFSYQKGKGKTEKQLVEPYGLCFRSGFWYLVGYSRKRGEYRLYRTDRISSLKVTGETFERDPSFDLRRFWDDDLPKQYRDRGSEVRIEFDPSVANEIRKTAWGAGRVRTLESGWIELTFRTFDLDRLVSFVLSFGPRARLIEPRSLKGKIKRSLREALKNYG